MTIMSSSSKVSEILLRNAVTMFVDEEYVNINRCSDKEECPGEPSASQSKFTRSKSLKESFKITFKRNAMITRSFSRSKSSEFASEDDKQVPDRRAISASPLRDGERIKGRPVPTPLLVEDPPSSENGSDLDDVKYHNNPALLNGMCMSDSVMLCFVQGFEGREKDAKDSGNGSGKEHRLQQIVKNKLLRKSRSSGNFGSAGARSAPSTPQGLLGSSPAGFSDPLSQPSSPGYISPSIQRSPSHNLFTKYDKGALKQLSCSTPVMTAQAQSPEPPSPKASSKDEKNTTSKARQKKFHRHFPVVDDDEKVLNHYSCALIGDILLQGQLYITSNYFAFYSNVFGYVTKLLIPLLSVQKITKEKTARIIPNAIGIATPEDKHVFGSLMSRDSTYRYMYDVWDRARRLAPIEPIPMVRTPSDVSDSSETKEESEKESATSEINPRFSKCTMKQELRKPSADCIDKPMLGLTSKLAEDPRIPYLSKQKLLLFASTFLLVLLFFSAAVLLYRIGKIQHKYTLALQDNFAVAESDDVYSELLQWQTHLHSKSAGAVHSFLDTNLDQIAKVRQSLEALSTLLMPNESNISHNTATPSSPDKSEKS